MKRPAKKKFAFQEGISLILFPLSFYGIWDTSLLIRQNSSRVGDNVAIDWKDYMVMIISEKFWILSRIIPSDNWFLQ
jgi:hypothetical protein